MDETAYLLGTKRCGAVLVSAEAVHDWRVTFLAGALGISRADAERAVADIDKANGE